MELNLLECSFVAKERELLHDFHFLGITVLLAHVEDLREVECTGRSYYSSDIVSLADVVEKQESLSLFLHKRIKNQKKTIISVF